MQLGRGRRSRGPWGSFGRRPATPVGEGAVAAVRSQRVAARPSPVARIHVHGQEWGRPSSRGVEREAAQCRRGTRGGATCEDSRRTSPRHGPPDEDGRPRALPSAQQPMRPRPCAAHLCSPVQHPVRPRPCAAPHMQVKQVTGQMHHIWGRHPAGDGLPQPLPQGWKEGAGS